MALPLRGIVSGTNLFKEGQIMTKKDLIKFLELFVDEIEIKVKGEGFRPIYTFNRDTGVGEVALILDWE